MNKLCLLSYQYVFVMPVSKSYDIAKIGPLCKGSHEIGISSPPISKISDLFVNLNQNFRTSKSNFLRKFIIDL